MIEIRRFTETDNEFKELARVDNLVNHDSISHPDYDKDTWKIRDQSIIRDRILLYSSNTLIGVVYYSQGRDENSRTTFFRIYLDPKYNDKDYRELLYQNMLDEVKKFNCNKLLTDVYEHPNYTHCQELLINNGFKLVQTNREYSCDIRKIDLQSYQPLIEKLESEGIKFYDSKKEMRDLPRFYEKLEKLLWTYSKDFPIPDGIEHTRMPFDQFKKYAIDFETNSYGIEIIAVKDNEFIASTDLTVYHKSEPHKAWTGGLGVLKEFRRKGIATALKIKAIEGLLEKGITEVRTDNEENNPMYKINIALGFKAVPFNLEYMKEI